MQLVCERNSVYIRMRYSQNEPVCVTRVLFLPSSFTGALYSPCGGPENHERQCRGLQVHYPLLGGAYVTVVSWEKDTVSLISGRVWASSGQAGRQALLLTAWSG